MSTTMEALACSNELPNFLVYDTISASPHAIHYLDHSQPTTAFAGGGGDHDGFVDRYASALLGSLAAPPESGGGGSSSCKQAAVPSSSGRKKRRRRPRSCKNKEEAESQRMTHIAVERNRRRQMNEHLAVLRSLMPESYIQRGDQASIVGGAIDFVKELEQLLQSLEVQQRTLQHNSNDINNETTTADGNSPPFAQFFSYPQYMWCHAPREYTPENHRAASAAVADIEVTLIETHANLRILSRKRPGQLLKMVAGFQALQLSILHLNVTTLDLMVLYSFSAKVEEGCNLTTVDDIAAAVHHMLSLIETEASAAAAAL